MKKAALIRIILYSIVLAILLVLLGLLLFENRWGGSWGLNLGNRTLLSGGEEATTEQFSSADVDEIVVKWIAGKINISTEYRENIEFSSTESSDYLTVYKLEDRRLTIAFCPQELFRFISHQEKKDLTLRLPQDWEAKKLTIESVSADLQASGLRSGKLDLDNISGNCELTDCVIRDVDMDTVSGGLTLSGSFETVKTNGVSAKCVLTATSCPDFIKMDTVSGDLELYFPEEYGFRVDMDGVNKSFRSDLSTTTEDGRYIHPGNETCLISVDTVSGSLTIRKAN